MLNFRDRSLRIISTVLERLKKILINNVLQIAYGIEFQMLTIYSGYSQMTIGICVHKNHKIIEDGTYISNCKLKADIFNKYFAHQCTINDNGSVLPNFISKTDTSLYHVSVTKNHIINIIKNLNSTKAHGYDGISVTMLKLCASEVAIHLQKFSKIALIRGDFQIAGNMPMSSLFTKKLTVR